MSEEFYHKDIFGTVVDVNLQASEDEVTPLDKKCREFNVFPFADAFGSRDKRKAWVLYQQALLAGVAADRIFFTLMWKIKSLMTFRRSDILKNLSERMVIGYHQARRGKGEIETFLEKTILSL